MERRLIWLLLLGLLAWAPACTLYGERPVVDHWKDATGGEGLERSFWEDVKTKSWDELDGHVASNYIAMMPTGKMDRAAAFERLRHFDLKDFSLANVQTELHADTFVVTYQMTLIGKFDDQPFTAQPVPMMSLWQHEKRGWVTIARTELGNIGEMQK
jgi:hypothetical protein